jgi:hypothetical protein
MPRRRLAQTCQIYLRSVDPTGLVAKACIPTNTVSDCLPRALLLSPPPLDIEALSGSKSLRCRSSARVAACGEVAAALANPNLQWTGLRCVAVALEFIPLLDPGADTAPTPEPLAYSHRRKIVVLSVSVEPCHIVLRGWYRLLSPWSRSQALQVGRGPVCELGSV